MNGLLNYRDEFPGLKECTHMLSHSLGAMPSRAQTMMQTYLEQWQNQTSWMHWLPFVDTFGNKVAHVLGVDPGSIFFHQNCTTAQAVVASCFDWRGARNKIVCSALDFPTQLYLWQAQSKLGANVEIVPAAEDGFRFSLDRFIEAIDENTRIVSVSHVFYQSSEIADIETICKHAHQKGAWVLVDCYQSAGTLPLNLKNTGVDFACGGSVKWICGGPGAAYLYVRPDLRNQLNPTLTGWFGHASPFAFEPPPVRYAETAWRMANGTPPMPALYAAASGWEIIDEIGTPQIRTNSLRQTQHLIDLVDQHGFELRSPREPAVRGGTVCFDFKGSNAVTDALRNQRFLCDWRPRSGLRASPHFYTRDDEIDLFVERLLEIKQSLGDNIDARAVASV